MIRQLRSFCVVIAASATLAACASGGGGDAPGGLAGAMVGLGSPGALVGRSERQVRGLLGAPSFQRADGPARVWQYRGTRCLLDVFMYKEGGDWRVKHAELRRRGSPVLGESACLNNAVSTKATS